MPAATKSLAVADRYIAEKRNAGTVRVGQISKEFSGEASAVDTVFEYPTLPLEANMPSPTQLQASAGSTIQTAKLAISALGKPRKWQFTLQLEWSNKANQCL
jgi:hypothetical protein